MKHTIDAYNELTEILIQEEYDKLIKSGVDEKKQNQCQKKAPLKMRDMYFQMQLRLKLS